MDVKRELAKNQPLVDKAIEACLPRKLDEKKLSALLGKARYAYDVKTAEKSIHEPVWDLLDRGGKRWRPSLLLWSAGALGAKGDILPFSAIPEVIHNGTLVIDDLEDGALLRRGKPCLHVKYGVDIAVNAGSGLYFIPLLVISKSKLPAKTKSRMYEIVLQEMTNLSYGQGFDIYWHRGLAKKVTEKQYLQMCAYKTGTLARMSARLGAALAEASLKQESALSEFAEALGVAFQIQDDILNLIPEDENYGKTVGEDITEGKRTLMVIRALGKLDRKEAGELVRILNSHTSSSGQINRAIELLKTSGSIDYAAEKAKTLVVAAWKKLDRLLKESEDKKKLKALAWYAIERTI